MQEYGVSYNINVNTGQAIESMQQFKAAVEQFGGVSSRLDLVSKSISKINTAFSSMGTASTQNIGRLAKSLTSLSAHIDKLSKKENVIRLKLRTGDAQAQLDKLLAKINQIKESGIITIRTPTANGGSTKNTTSAVPPIIPSAPKAPKAPSASKPSGGSFPRQSQYSTWGSTYYNSGTNIAGEMIKGMGIAYALSSVMTGVGNVFKDATQYQNLITTMQGILQAHDNRPDFLKDFKETVFTMRQIAADTKFTAPEAAAAGRQLAMAGLDVNQIKYAIRPIANVAVIGDTNLGATAEAMTTILTGYKIPATKMDRAADVLTETFASTNSTLMTLSEAFHYSAALFKKANVPFETATAAIGILGDAGIKGSHAGTTMRTLLLNLVKPTSLQLKAWKKMGVERYDKNGNLRSLIDIFKDLNTKHMTLRDAGYMFSRTAASGAVALSQDVGKWQKVTDDNKKSRGLASRFAYLKENYTVSGLWYQLTSAFTEQGIRKFEGFQTKIMSFIRELIAMVKSPGFVKALGNAMDMFFDMAKFIAQAIGWATKLYNLAPGLIGGFIKFQMVIGVVAGTLKTFYSAFKFLIVGAVGGTVIWAREIINAWKALKGVAGTLKVIEILQAMIGGHQALQNIAGGASVAASTGEKEVGGTIAAGGTATKIAGWIGTIFSSPLTWLAGGLTVAGIAAYHSAQETRDYTNRLRTYGLNVSGPLERLAQSSSNAANALDKVAAKSPKLSDNKGLMDNLEIKDNASTGGWTKFIHFLTSAVGSQYGSYGENNTSYSFSASALADKANALLSYPRSFGQHKYDYISKNSGYIPFLGNKYKTDNPDDLQRLNNEMYLYQAGKNDPELSKNIDAYMDRIFNAKDAKQYDQVFKDIAQDINYRLSDKWTKIGTLSVEAFKKLAPNQVAHTYAATQAYADAMNGVFNFSLGKMNVAFGALRRIITNTSSYFGDKFQDYYTLITNLPKEMGGDEKSQGNWKRYVYWNKKYNRWGFKQGAPESVKNEIASWSEDTLSSYVDSKKRGDSLQFSELVKHKKKGKLMDPNTPENYQDFLKEGFGGRGGGKKGGKNGVNNSGFKPTDYGYGASPKQIVIRIGNLMKVDKVDMTEGGRDKAEKNLREAFAQVLVDVVADAGELVQSNI